VIGPIQDASGNIVTECGKKGDTFNKFFASVFTLDNGMMPLHVKKAEPGIKISDVSFGANMVLRLLVKQKSKTSMGPDELPSIFYKKLAHCLASPMSIMFACIFAFGKLPSIWKQAIVIPIPKKGSMLSVRNY